MCTVIIEFIIVKLLISQPIFIWLEHRNMSASQECGSHWRDDDDVFLARFKLPPMDRRSNDLALRNPLPHDRRIQFDETSHTYTLDGEQLDRSVTGFLHSFCSEFDAMEAANSALRGRNADKYRSSDGSLPTAENLVRMWSTNGDVQRARGTLLHYQAFNLYFVLKNIKQLCMYNPRGRAIFQWAICGRRRP